MNINEYFLEIEDKVRVCYDVAEEARRKGLDPVSKVEIPLAANLAEKCLGLISTIYPQLNDKKIATRILELERQSGPLDMAVAFKIAEEIAKEKFCKFSSLLEAIDAGIRVGFAYMTLGVVSSPIEGFTELKLGKTRKGEDYFIAYFSGPIRSAGTTASCMVLMLVDYLREIFGFAKYDIDEREVKRYVTENYDYHERVTNLQYLPTEEEIEFLARNLPIQISGEPTEKKEVSNYKDLDRVETNFIRGGMCLIFSEGLAQKAQKGLRLYRGLQEKGFLASGFNFLENYIKIHKKREKGSVDASPTYIKDIVAGRPVFSHPSRSGGFRFRYGRSRVNGFSAASIHPATMAVSNSFLSTGTQLKVEKPTKGCAITVCDSIDGPIVKLRDGSLKKLENFEEAKKIYKDVSEIVYIGDILFSLGDVINRNYELLKPGYVEEWWFLELEKVLSLEKENSFINNIKEKINIDSFSVSLEEAIRLSEKYKIPLHPKYIFYWTQISYGEFLALLDWIAHCKIAGKIILPYNKAEKERFRKGKRAMEILGIEHNLTVENVVLSEETSKILLLNLGMDAKMLEKQELNGEMNEIFKKIDGSSDALEAINKISRYNIKDKAGTFIGARMGRPEKAKLRKLIGSPSVLFPIGEEGGRFRSVNEAVEMGSIKAEFPIYFCRKCNKETIYFICEDCGSECQQLRYCPDCQNKFVFEICPEHAKGQTYMNKRIDSKHYFKKAIEKLKLEPEEIPTLIKGVRGTSNAEHVPENLAKGILRSLFRLHVNKDGTIRYDATELPITHFKPCEIGTSMEKLRGLGYLRDIHGNVLENPEQILEIKPHDIILPSCPESKDERADEVFLNIARFIDSLLFRFYGLEPFYNIKEKEDLIGQLTVCMAPHNCAGVITRIIGFSKVQGLFASPYVHAAVRRDCVHPETKIFFYNEDTEEAFYDSIGKHVEKLIANGARIKKIDSFGTLRVENRDNIYCLGIDPVSHELKKKKIKYFIKGPETKEWVKITTSTNRGYVMTPTHKFMYVEDGNFKFKSAKEIRVEDKIPVLSNFNFNLGADEIDLINLFKKNLSEKEQKEILVNDGEGEVELPKFSGEGKNIKIRHKFSHRLFSKILKIDFNLMRILGYYAAEGHSRQNKSVSQVGFRICQKDVQEHLIDLIKRTFNINANLGDNNSKITICSKIVYYLFKCIGAGRGAYEKRVPKFIFGLNQELVGNYLSAFFEGDGSVIKEKGIAVFYSVSKNLLDDMALLLSKFQIMGRYFKTGLRMPGKKVLERYKELRKEPKQHVLNHLVLGRYDSLKLKEILSLANKSKQKDLEFIKGCEKRYVHFNNKQILLEAQSDYVADYVKKVEIVKDTENSYCVEIDWKEIEDRNILWGEQIINTRCDGDEVAIMLLLDVLLNFSKKFLPAHRGGTQDAPLVLNSRINAGEVDDQILDFELGKYPLELYEMAERGEHSSKVGVETVRKRLKEGKNPLSDIQFTHDCSNFNSGVINSSYKSIPTMQEKVSKQMELVEKIRATDATDVARLVIERHFIRDIRGNLRKFSQQEFRCSTCNEKYRRPLLSGVCTCGGRIIFTISEGSIVKYLEPALELARRYAVPPYVKQNIELTKRYIESIFGREKEKQEALGKWA